MSLPAGISSFNANYIHGGATCLIVINNSVCDPTEIVNWTLGTIPAGRAVTVSLPLFVAGLFLKDRLASEVPQWVRSHRR